MTPTCEICRQLLPAYCENQEFRDDRGRQEYHTLEMATWLANQDGRLGQVVEWYMSARGSKKGLVTGYSYDTGRHGADGLGLHCSIKCQAIAATEAAAIDKGPAKPAGGHDTTRPAGLPASPGPDKAIPGEITARRLQQIRRGLRLTTDQLARALGYGGAKPSNETTIARFECGQRTIPTAIGRLAAMYELYGVPTFKGVDHGKEPPRAPQTDSPSDPVRAGAEIGAQTETPTAED